MEAQTLNCPNCGAAINSDSSQCRYCESKLATVACPTCFGMMFLGSKHCPHCGTAAGLATAAELSVLKCPRCKRDMTAITLGATAMRECEECEGLWVEVAAFKRICTDREEHSAVLGVASPMTPKSVFGEELPKAVYVPCPQCGQLMNRINFAHCSGVIVDVCRAHGTWFDRDELRKIVEFIHDGGLEHSRQKEMLEIKAEREKLTALQRLNAPRSDVVVSFHSENDRVDGLSAARELLKFLIE